MIFVGSKINRVVYHLDSKGIKNIPFEEIKLILRGADHLIVSRGILCKLKVVVVESV